MKRMDRAFVVGLMLTSLFAASARAGGGCLPAWIPDDGYIGTDDGNDGTGPDAGMLCCDHVVQSQFPFPAAVSDVNLEMKIGHTWIGDLVIKLRSPEGTVSKVLSRPGGEEPSDDGAEGFPSDGSDWAWYTVLTFDEQSGGPSAETMGSTIGPSESVCVDDGICEYTPHAAAEESGDRGLDVDFDGETYIGSWQLCVGDAERLDQGTWYDYLLTLTVDRSIPCVCGGRFRGGDRVRFVGNPTSNPAVGTEGEVMCGNVGNPPLLVAWDGYAGHGGLDSCDCPSGSLATSNGWYVGCDDVERVLPFRDDFETGDLVHWSSAVTGS